MSLNASGQLHLEEGFESGSRPVGWTEEGVVGNEPWRYRNGGHNPSDINWTVPAYEVDIARNPDGAYSGTYNAIFFKQGDGNERTKLITPELDLLGAVNVELSFYLCQVPWTFEGSTTWDVLRVYYKTSLEGDWSLLHEYLDPIYEWEKQVLYLPEAGETYYVAFEGQTRWGFGTCIDDILIQETGSQEMELADIVFEQPFPDYIPSGSSKVPILRIRTKVTGNTGSLTVSEMSFHSLNTNDNDLLVDGIRLFATISHSFSDENPISASGNFIDGVVNFSGMNYTLPGGYSYIWLTYDIDENAKHNDLLDILVKANDIWCGSNSYPAIDQSPVGNRTIFQSIYSEGFEVEHNWTLFGEFQVDTPDGGGGSPGNPNPDEAFGGTKILGTDLTGLGTYPYHYESGLNNTTRYTASSPQINALYYKNLNIFFQRYLNIEVWDVAAIDVSTDNGLVWNNIWMNDSYLSDFYWSAERIEIPNAYARTNEFKIRYRLGPTDGANNYTGWNIDDVFVTGEFISKDVGVSAWLAPLGGSGHTSADTVIIRITNYGGSDITVPVPVAYSLDGGDNWTINYMNDVIPVGQYIDYAFGSLADFSTPGLYPEILAKTYLPGDQYTSNDQVSTSIYVLPTYSLPYHEDFESNQGYYRASGLALWEYGKPVGITVNSASSGENAWMTSLTGTYGSHISNENHYLFDDDFETDLGWTVTGEFERATPSNMYYPYFAYSGYFCMGTDLTGKGDSLYLYENNISEGTASTVISPAIDVSQYSNLEIGFARKLEIQDGDSVKLEVSNDDGSTWYRLWVNEGAISDQYYQYYIYQVPDSLSYTTTMRFRFSLFHSSASGPVAAGMNFDNFTLTGYLADLSNAYLNSPSFDLKDLTTPVFEARLWSDTEAGQDGVSLYYSLDDGDTWTNVSNTNGYDNYWNWYSGDYLETLLVDGWSGHEAGWKTVKHLLPGEVKGKENVQFQFRFGANKTDNNYDGIAIDDIRIYEAPHDIGLENVNTPFSACVLTDQEHFNIRIRNYGVRAIQPGDSMLVNYEIDYEGNTILNNELYYFDRVISPGAAVDISLLHKFNFERSGTYNVLLWLEEDDPYFYRSTSNDSLTAVIEVRKPELDIGADISTASPDTVILDAETGVAGDIYLWNDLSMNPQFNVDTAGTYSVVVTNLAGCQSFDTISVELLEVDLEAEELLHPQSACALSNEYIQVLFRNNGSDTIPAGDSLFVSVLVNDVFYSGDTIFFGGKMYPGDSILYSFPESYDFTVPGSYSIEVEMHSKTEFVSNLDTLSQVVRVYGYPDIDLGPDRTISAASYLLEPGSGYFSYFWQDSTTSETYNVTEPGYGKYTVRVTNEFNCEAIDSVVLYLELNDLELEEILSPASTCELSTDIVAAVRVRNSGNVVYTSGSQIDLSYTVNGAGGSSQSFILGQSFSPGESIDLTFSLSETVVTGQWYTFVFVHNGAEDVISENDTLTRTFGVFDPPALDLGDDYTLVTDDIHILDAGPGFSSYVWQDGSTGQFFNVTVPGLGIYNVLATDANGCQAFDEVQVFMARPDIAVEKLLFPYNSCSLSEEGHVSVRLRNKGNYQITSADSFSLSYSINGSEVVIEDTLLEADWEVGDSLIFTFRKAEDFSKENMYTFILYVSFAADKVPQNNIIFGGIAIKGSPDIDINGGADTLYIDAPLTLSVDTGYYAYAWNDGSEYNTLSVTEPGSRQYSVVVTAENGCISSDSVYVVYDRPDLSILGFLSLENSCGLETDHPVTIELVNLGYTAIGTDDTLLISYSVNDVLVTKEKILLETELLPGESVEITFGTAYDLSGSGNYNFKAYVEWSPDTDGSNNLYPLLISVYGGASIELENGMDTVEVELPYTLDAGSTFISYRWQDNSVEQTFEVTQEGLYWVEVSNLNGCPGADSVYVKQLVSREELIFGNAIIRVYPVPARDYVSIELLSDQMNSCIIELYTVTNKLLHQEELNIDDISNIKIDLSGYEPGVYLLVLRNGTLRKSEKLIKY